MISTSGLSNVKLALNRSATFIAELTNYEGDTSNLTYRWSLDVGRGELSDGNNALSGTSDSENTVYCLGKRAGSEKITLEVLDNNNFILGRTSMDFEIVMPTDPDISRGCYDQPKIIYQRNGNSGYVCNFDGLNQQCLALQGILD